MSKKALQDAIRFRQPFTEKYTLTVDTDVQSGSFIIRTKTVIRWSLQVIAVDDQGNAEIELLTLENLLVETNDSSIQEIAALNQVFSKMYSELHLNIDINGKVKTVLNLKHIQGKWEKTKQELKEIQEQVPELQTLLNLNDEIFNAPEKIKIAIENNEFFKHYFNKTYGKPQPIAPYSVEQLNLLQTAPTSWDYKFTRTPDYDFKHINDIKITYTGDASASADNEWKKKAYGHLQGIDTKELNPVLTEGGVYDFDAKTGRLHHAEIVIKEIADPNFIHGNMHFVLESDSNKMKNNNGTNSEPKKEDTEHFSLFD